MTKPTTLEGLLEYINELELRIAALEQVMEPDTQRRNTITVLQDILSEKLQAMEDDEFVEDEEEGDDTN